MNRDVAEVLRWARRRLLGLGMAAMLTGLSPAQAALISYDNFTGTTGTNAVKWTEITLGNGAVSFDGAQAFVDMTSPTTGKLAKMAANALFARWEQNGDAFRLTWDMQIADDSLDSYANGLVIGPISAPLRAGQVGGGRGLTYPRSFFVSGAGDTVDHGAFRYHYDLTATMPNTGTGSLNLTLKIYNHNPLYDNDPAGYASQTPVCTLSSSGASTLSANVDHPLLFYAERYDNTGDGYAQKRAKIAVDNVFVESPHFHNPTVGIVSFTENNPLNGGFGVQTNDDLQKARVLGQATITASPGLQWGSVTALADASSSSSGGSTTAVKDGAGGGTIDIWFDPAYSMNRPLSDITITVYGAGDDRRYWDFDLLYGMANDPTSFQMLFSGKDSTMAAGVGTQIRLSNFTVPVAPFDTLRLVLRPSSVAPYHATTLWEIDVNFVPEPSAFGLALGFAMFGTIGYYMKNRRRIDRS